MNWKQLDIELPPKNTLVLVKRMPNKIEDEPLYFAMRQDKPLSTNPDASRDTYWWGNHKNTFLGENEVAYNLDGFSNFSDVTVKEWCYITDLLT